MSSTKLIFKNMAKEWECATSAPSESIIVFSPYVTTPIAEKVLQYNPESKSDFYTQFHAEIFINKASSLSALRKIIDNGYKIYFLSNLHAKIVLIDNDFATIGSQNITYNGTFNKEANTIFTDTDIVVTPLEDPPND